MRTHLLGLGSLSMFDATRMPPGKAIAHLWDYAPYVRPDGMSWDDAKDVLRAQHAGSLAGLCVQPR